MVSSQLDQDLGRTRSGRRAGAEIRELLGGSRAGVVPDASAGLELPVGSADEVQQLIRARCGPVVDTGRADAARGSNENANRCGGLSLEDAVDAQGERAAASSSDGAVDDGKGTGCRFGYPDPARGFLPRAACPKSTAGVDAASTTVQMNGWMMRATTKAKRPKPTEFNTLGQAAAARFLGISRQRVGTLVTEGKLTAYEFPGLRGPRILMVDLEERKAELGH